MKQATASCPAKVRRSARGDKFPDIRKLRAIPILKHGEPWITHDEVLRRARANPITNHGKRFAEKLAADLNAGRVSCKNWHVLQHVIFAKGSRRRGGGFYAWGVVRSRGGFNCSRGHFTDCGVYSSCRLLRLDE